jgi:hypothetical protein
MRWKEEKEQLQRTRIPYVGIIMEENELEEKLMESFNL